MINFAFGLIGLGFALLFLFWIISLFVTTVTTAFKPPPPPPVELPWDGGRAVHRVGGRRIVGRSINMEDVPLLEEEEPF